MTLQLSGLFLESALMPVVSSMGVGGEQSFGP